MNRISAGLFALTFCLPAVADEYDSVRERIAGMVGENTEIAVADSPIEGIVQVRIASDIVYMSADGRYLIQGRLLDLDTREDLTDGAKSEIRREVLETMDHDQLISFGADDSEYEIVVFTDVDCGYCRRLHEQIDDYIEAGIQVSYAAFPRAGAGSETYNKMVSVWCADDPHEAMTVAKAGGTPEPAECDSPVDAQYALGQSLGVTGTPALMTSQGDLIPGYVPADRLRDQLERLATRGNTE